MSPIRRTLRRLLPLLPLCFALNAVATDDIFMQLPGIKGESTDKVHAGWINVQSISSCFAHPTGGKSSSACEISIGKEVDASSTFAYNYLMTGKSFGTSKVLIDICTIVPATGAQVCYYKIELNQVTFTASSDSTSSGNTKVTQSWSMSFGAIKWTYTPIDAKGGTGTPVSQCWDFITNTATCP